MNASTWQHAKQLLAEAAELPELDREQYVTEHCTDPSLRRELLELLTSSAPLSDIVAIPTLPEGARVGPYVVEALVGRGGMGEVYRAQDTRLGRYVAIKILPALFADDSGRLARFEREANVLATLNHPNICALFDIGRDDGIDYLVMEYVEGVSLAERLAKGPLPIEQALPYAVQIADALDKAHARDIVHRDLKPGNVMLAKAGAKLLDFGLARNSASRRAAALESRSPTISPTPRSLTAAGTILGTCRYMAPEQLEGAEADARCDIWAFGCLVYEMITGRPAFEGRSQASLIAAILEKDPPPLTASQPLAPSLLEHIVRRCLTKAPDDRWQSAADVRHQLAWIAETRPDPSTPATRVPVRRRERVAYALAAVGVAATIVTAAINQIGARRDAPQPIMQFTLGLPEQFQTPGRLMTLAPDGQRLAFVGKNPNGGDPVVWIRSIDTVESRPLAGTEGLISLPFWSPDGKSLGFFSDGKLKRIDVASGAIQSICDAPSGRGGTWSRDGTIVFSPDRNAPLYRIASSGASAPVPVTELAKSSAEQSHRLPSFLPDGQHFVFTVIGDGWYGVAVGSLASSEKIELMKRPADSRDPFDGLSQVSTFGDFLLFARAGALYARRLDRARWELVGDPVTVQPGIDRDDLGRWAFTVSNELLIYRPASASKGMRQLTWVTRTGQILRTLWEPGRLGGHALSPDGRYVAVAREDPRASASDIWVVDVDDGSARRLTNSRSAANPLWSPDGTRILFTLERSLGAQTVGAIRADGNGPEEVVVGSPAVVQEPDGWTADGALVLGIVNEADGNNQTGYWTLAPGNSKPTLLFKPDSGHAAGHYELFVSPDGRYLSYSLGTDVFIQPLPGGARVPIANDGDWTFASPQWRADGKELYYVAKGKVIAVGLRPGATIQVGARTTLFDYPPNADSWGPSNDGQRFLIEMPVATNVKSPPLTAVLNWSNALPKR